MTPAEHRAAGNAVIEMLEAKDQLAEMARARAEGEIVDRVRRTRPANVRVLRPEVPWVPPPAPPLDEQVRQLWRWAAMARPGGVPAGWEEHERPGGV